jgi:F-type H+-transporting ATPase subunit b
MTLRAWVRLLIVVAVVALAAPASAQDHGAPQNPPTSKGAQPVEAPHEATPKQGAAADDHAATEEEHHEEGILPTIARLFNFAILVGVLVYFLRQPIADYMTARSTQVRQDLVTAAEMRRVATAQLAEIEEKMKSLPAELDALKARGAEDVKAEQARIAAAAAAERERLIDQTRREIDMRLRVAKRDLTEHAAALAVQVAEQRIKRTITPEDQMRLLDRYTTQLREAQ